MTVISLTTDFGLQDEYVGVMKAVILSAAPDTRIVDLCHGIEPQSVVQAAFMIATAYRYFPPGTLHLLVVDPGVGGARRIIYADADGHSFLCPDNGLLTGIARSCGLTRVCAVTNRRLFNPHPSATFHGRDIMAPVAAFIVRGGDVLRLGDEMHSAGIVHLNADEPRVGPDGGLRGQIVSIDRFGSLVTDIGVDLLGAMLADNPKQRFRIDAGWDLTTHLHDAYEEASPGAALAIIGSRQTLEIAVNRGRASDSFPAAIGRGVTVRRLADTVRPDPSGP
jgi:hypothetical protein